VPAVRDWRDSVNPAQDQLQDPPDGLGDMKWIGEYYKPDLILIPIGGHFTMGPVDAAYATKQTF